MSQIASTADVKNTSDMLIERAQGLAPLLREKARDAEIARRPLDEVIEAIRDSGLFAMMVPKLFGGHEMDLDTFFETVLILSKADASMGWLTGFYIEHNFWFFHYPPAVYEQLFQGTDHVLAPGTLNVGAGNATRVDGGYRLSGQWQWGTGIIHGTWVMAGALLADADGNKAPYFFLLPREDVDPIDTWHIAGMCGTGSWDFKVDDVFVPEDYGMPFLDLINVTSGITDRFDGPLYQTPLIPILGFAASLPLLGAAQMALEEFCVQTKRQIGQQNMRGGVMSPEGKNVVIAEAALTIETAELLLRDVLKDVMAKRNQASGEERGQWLARMSHAVHMCRDAVNKIGASAGAGGNMLDNPIQRAVRDINTASCHIVFDRDSRYGDYGRQLFGLPPTNMLV